MAEVVARMAARRATSAALSEISGIVRPTPGEVRAVQPAARVVPEAAEPIEVPRAVGEFLLSAVRDAARAARGGPVAGVMELAGSVLLPLGPARIPPSSRRPRRDSRVTVAPEVASLIVADRAAGVPVSVTCARLHMEPREVLCVLRAARVVPEVAPPVVVASRVVGERVLAALRDVEGHPAR